MSGEHQDISVFQKVENIFVINRAKPIGEILSCMLVQTTPIGKVVNLYIGTFYQKRRQKRSVKDVEL
ncbi:MAG: hypothetical protein A2735_01700 [Candidatus Yanofskybacteria bacterium RIFCSPHIGHO2_01_FULL_41_21]|uniref:Uncharacterized protein n=1 Tax=Candidatus Yanofskybacteria bacterium RIFCSPHIGHO2_01_FULL_41_21 TaxID=1802660 RepID=A0A1F8E964_9BACT|nr:MAG: hypothetical protein A2735_01700 [Candidatus Yanofskybacteria bacterium RIFCSPHIGHO2_01_FULL_41_21]